MLFFLEQLLCLKHTLDCDELIQVTYHKMNEVQILGAADDKRDSFVSCSRSMKFRKLKPLLSFWSRLKVKCSLTKSQAEFCSS